MLLRCGSRCPYNQIGGFFDPPPFIQIIMSTPFHSNECSRTPARQDPGPSRSNNGATLTGSPSREGPEAPGDEKDEEIARLKRAYHDAVTENKNKKVSAKTNT